MTVLIMIFIGLAGGVVGGMGMGGGTLLIPLLVVFTDIPQHGAQAINLAVFIPMSIVALVIHFKNKLVDVKKAVFIAVPAVTVSVLSSILAGKVSDGNLSVYFGIFLLVLGVYQLVSAIISRVKCAREKKQNDSKSEYFT